MKPKTKVSATLEDRLFRLEEQYGEIRERCLQLERVVRVIGRDFEKTHLSEEASRRWALRANSLSNAMREIRKHLKRYGNEFDKAPHFVDPENDSLE